MRLRERLETAANVAIVLTCAFFASVLAINTTRSGGGGANAGGKRPPAYAVGDKVGFSGLELGATGRSLLLVFKSSCKFCTESMPFYRSIAESVPTAGRPFRFVGITTDDAATGKAYLANHELKLSGLVSVRPSALRITGTPTLLLVDSSGKIERIWSGRLPREREAEVLATAFGAKVSRGSARAHEEAAP